MSVFSQGVLAFMFGAPGVPELMIVAIIGLLLFGKRLPTVAKDIGKSIVEFKKGVRGIEDEVETSTYQQTETPRPPAEENYEEVTAPKFEPPVSEPTASDDDSGETSSEEAVSEEKSE